MKKLLLGSTALAAAGLISASAMAADPIRVTINGYYQWYFVVGGWDRLANGDKGRTTGVRQEGEIWFNGITKLDNGTNVGFRIELEAYEFGDQVDEHYLFFSGDWGRFELGATNGVMSKMVYGAPSALPGYGFISQNFNFQWSAAQTLNTAFSTAIQDDRHNGDANKISYFTPRFAGFQIGVSYTPDMSPGNGNLCGATGGSATSFGVCLKNQDNRWTMYQAAINYLATFNSVNLALYGGLMYGDPDNKGSAWTVGGLGGTADDWWHWLVGFNVTFQGFSIGGNIGRDNNGQKASTHTWMYTLGATYTTGPWTVGAGGRHFRRHIPGPLSDDKVWQFEVGANYRIGPGIALAGGLIWNENSGDRAGGAFPNVSKDSWQLVFGTALTF